jgi:hypothetical protein
MPAAIGRLVQPHVGVRRQEQDIDRSPDELVDMPGLDGVVALRVADDGLGIRAVFGAVVADVVVLVRPPFVAPVRLAEADDGVAACRLARRRRRGGRRRCRGVGGRRAAGPGAGAAHEDDGRPEDETR